MPNMIPDYEIRLLLNPTLVLSPENELTDTVQSTFGISPSEPTKLDVQFLDTNSKELYTAGWSARIRKIDTEDHIELTYKKRYEITGGDIDAALAAANNDGFNVGNTKYEAQVEWGYQKQTLSISRKKPRANSENSGTGLPGIHDSREMLINEAPGKFDNWKPNKWGTTMLAASRIFGPVHASRSTGSWNGMQVYLEVWPLVGLAGKGIEYIVEISFKTESRKTAAIEQGNLAAFLQCKGWLLKKDSLKTQLIMERY
ncbi:uncharacterized protein Aud_005094 [Aspergillus udagawae]|uniref:Uncharacterized protein n=1 Tax=Aspergillus udagawae TaxID=91492 RepID=A0A8E0QTR0_9EURO|nr:uncharacterized protein Aud_005094 [Aspergillus udagawae]GIC88696.1 hypothetical protein Aud_005094 [Aspergillus udagawae]